MNAVEIEEAVAQLAVEPFDAVEFPFAFLRAFDNKDATIARLRAGATNASDVPGGVLQRNHIHLATCDPGKVTETLAALKASAKTAKAKAKFLFATDGEQIEAQDLVTDEPLACPFNELAKHFGFFLPLAGITTVQEIKDNPIDIKATGRLFKLYMQLLKDNPEWTTDARRHDLNQFMARLIFCFFAEDTGIFFGNGLFSQTISQMSDATNTHEVIGELFRAMDLPIKDREAAKLRPWADAFPYVNGGLFTGTRDTPHFSRMARAYLLSVGELDWKHINPDIFGSMIQGIADDDERGSLGLHYTSVPNILKVLDPLFLDDLRESLHEAGDNARKLLNLRKRIASIRVFDPACGSGNFLVIAYIRMREIEAEIIRRRNDERKSWIKLTNFYGIEIKDFACETARLSLLIAEFQCDARLIGQHEACLSVLPLKRTGQIHCGNALVLDWSEVCGQSRDSTGTDVADTSDVQDDELSETYICSNPPYSGHARQSDDQKSDIRHLFSELTSSWRSLDYVSGWFLKAAQFIRSRNAKGAFVSTNSICQGEQVPLLWPILFEQRTEIIFAHTSFKWANLASNNAVVTVVVVGLGRGDGKKMRFFSQDGRENVSMRVVEEISPYLVPGRSLIVQATPKPPDERHLMIRGNMPTDGGFLVLDEHQRTELLAASPQVAPLVRPYIGSRELIQGQQRFCLWITDADLPLAETSELIRDRLAKVRKSRQESPAASTRPWADKPHRFLQIQGGGNQHTIAVARVSSERREYLPVQLVSADCILSDLLFGLYDAPLWALSIIASRLHLVWIGTVCGKMKTDFRYSNVLGWNTFPIPRLTEKNREDLVRRATDILLAREASFPRTIADLYEPETMPDNLRRAHEANDETLERIYVGRRFKNDTERLETLFDLYARTPTEAATKKGRVK